MSGFQLKREQEIPEINSKVKLYEHIRTGAQLLSVENQDENKVFGVTFPTLPNDSTGVPHILEHAVLNGSRKYPVKEPFVELIKGSLASFVNAMTFSDKTTYPVASQNVQDFYNLIDVYLDAVFYPRIRPEILKQEGWHYELESLDAPLTYKGVVFNEMKGAYSSPDRLMYISSQRSLFPDTTYGVDSGGDPEEIPNLTYEQFKGFYNRFYHPSNALIYFYGDDDPAQRLKLIDDFLVEFERQQMDVKIDRQPAFDRPNKRVIPYDAGEGAQKKGMVTVSWALTDPYDVERTLAFEILEHILIGTSASPLRKALIDSGLGEDTINIGFQSDSQQMYFVAGLRGIDTADAEKVESLILETLEKLVNEGLDQDTVEASLNTIEFRLREQNTGGYPRGLFMMLMVMQTWLYGGDPFAPLAFEAPLNNIKAKFAEGKGFFESMIAAYFLDNSHRSTVVLQPDETVNQQKEAAEKARLEKVRASLSEDQLRRIMEETVTLHEMQETPDSPEDLAKLPMLKVSDLDRTIKTIPLEVLDEQGAKVLYHDLFTNGIAYLDVGFNLYSLPQRLLPYMTLFGNLLLEMGTEQEDFVKLSQRIGRKTGGIHATLFNGEVRDSDQTTAWFFLRGKGTVAQTADLLNIMRDVLLTVKLDNRERFRQIVNKSKAGKESGIVPGGHMLVNTRLHAGFTLSGWLEEQTKGIESLFFVRQLLERIENDWAGVLADLEAVRSHLVNRVAMLVNATIDRGNWTQVQTKLRDFVTSIPVTDVTLNEFKPDFAAINEGLTIPAQVNYVGKGANLYQLGYQLHGSVLAIPKYLGTTWLWEKIRVQGGAYGGFATFDSYSGVFNYLSYRDPNLLGSLENYDKTADFLCHLELSDLELTKAIIGAIANLDAYQLPDAKGFTSMQRYLMNVSDDYRQKMRDEVLGTTVKDFRAFGEILTAVKESGRVVVIGSTDAIESANAARGNFLTVKRVL